MQAVPAVFVLVFNSSRQDISFISKLNFFNLCAADARQRIVSERIDLKNNLVISVSVLSFAFHMSHQLYLQLCLDFDFLQFLSI